MTLQDKRKICQTLLIIWIIAISIGTCYITNKFLIPPLSELIEDRIDNNYQSFNWKILPIKEYILLVLAGQIIGEITSYMYSKIPGNQKETTEENKTEKAEDLFQPGTVVKISSSYSDKHCYYYIVRKTKSPNFVVISSFINKHGNRTQFEENIENLEVLISSNNVRNYQH